MTKFIGYESLIAYALIHLTDERFVYVSDINKYRIQIQKYWNSNNIDALFCDTIEYAVYDFRDYFELNKEAGIILLNSDISKESLNESFKKDIGLDLISECFS